MKKVIIFIIIVLIFIGAFIYFLGNNKSDLKYERVINLPNQVKFNKYKEGTEIVEYNNEYYVFIKMGEQKTGGYSIKINDIKINDDFASIRVSKVVPKKTDIVTQALTYPYDVIKFNKKPIVEVLYD